jgi:hypothetical protein
MNRFLFWLTSRLPLRIISDDGEPYLERYYLATFLGVRFYLHRFVGSDPARGLHDHPWRWAASIILSGFYYEETRRGVRPVRWLNVLLGDSFHRVLLPKAMIQRGGSIRVAADSDDPTLNGTGWLLPCWTRFFHRAAYTKPWGFLRGVKPDLERLQLYETVRVWVPYNYPKSGHGTNDPWWLFVRKARDEPRRKNVSGS